MPFFPLLISYSTIKCDSKIKLLMNSYTNHPCSNKKYTNIWRKKTQGLKSAYVKALLNSSTMNNCCLFLHLFFSPFSLGSFLHVVFNTHQELNSQGGAKCQTSTVACFAKSCQGASTAFGSKLSWRLITWSLLLSNFSLCTQLVRVKWYQSCWFLHCVTLLLAIVFWKSDICDSN